MRIQDFPYLIHNVCESDAGALEKDSLNAFWSRLFQFVSSSFAEPVTAFWVMTNEAAFFMSLPQDSDSVKDERFECDPAWPFEFWEICRFVVYKELVLNEQNIWRADLSKIDDAIRPYKHPSIGIERTDEYLALFLRSDDEK